MGQLTFEASGHVMLPPDAELPGSDGDSAILSFTRGEMHDGRPYWVYIAVKPSRYREFHALNVNRQSVVLGEYGTILAAGFGDEPPLETVREMEEKYGFDDAYESKLDERIRQQKKAFFDQREEKRLMDIVTMLKMKHSS